MTSRHRRHVARRRANGGRRSSYESTGIAIYERRAATRTVTTAASRPGAFVANGRASGCSNGFDAIVRIDVGADERLPAPRPTRRPANHGAPARARAVPAEAGGIWNRVLDTAGKDSCAALRGYMALGMGIVAGRHRRRRWRSRRWSRSSLPGGASGGDDASQPYPTRQLSIMAPAAAGGGWDTTARAFQAASRAAKLDDGIEVFNVEGAGGTLGLSAARLQGLGRPVPADDDRARDARRDRDQRLRRAALRARRRSRR